MKPRTDSDGLRCDCGGPIDRVIDSRTGPGYIRRRRVCTACGSRSTTREVVLRANPEDYTPNVIELARAARAFAADVLDLTIPSPDPDRAKEPHAGARLRRHFTRKYAPFVALTLR